MKRNYVGLAAVAAITAVVAMTTFSVDTARAAEGTTQAEFGTWWERWQARRSKAKEIKRTEKKAAAKAKELSKQKWVIYGSTRTLDDAILKHWEKMDKQDAYEAFGTARNCLVPANCRTAATNDAALNFARQMSEEVQAKIGQDAFLEQASKDNAAEFNRFYQALVSTVQGKIGGLLNPSFTLYNEKAQKMMIFYLIGNKEAAEIKNKAVENAGKTAKIGQEYLKTLETTVAPPTPPAQSEPKPSGLDEETPAPAIAETE